MLVQLYFLFLLLFSPSLIQARKNNPGQGGRKRARKDLNHLSNRATAPQNNGVRDTNNLVVVGDVETYGLKIEPKGQICFNQEVLFKGDVEIRFMALKDERLIEEQGDDEEKGSNNAKQSSIQSLIFVTVKSPEQKSVYDRSLKTGVEEVMRSAVKSNRGKVKYGEYSICFSSKSKDRVNLEFGVTSFERKIQEKAVLTPDKVDPTPEDEAKTKANRAAEDILNKQHLNPVEKTFASATTLTDNIISEMSYIKRREARMHKTSESTATRVKWFSMLSVSVLLGVGAFQVGYLKMYFKQKKLL